MCAAVSARTKGIPQIHLDFEILIFDKFDGVVSNKLSFLFLSFSAIIFQFLKNRLGILRLSNLDIRFA